MRVVRLSGISSPESGSGDRGPVIVGTMLRENLARKGGGTEGIAV